MKLLIHNKLGQPQEIEATRVIVQDNLGNPVALALKYGETADGRELVLTAHIGEPGGEVAFNELLRQMGIDRTVIVTDLPHGTPLNHVRFDDV